MIAGVLSLLCLLCVALGEAVKIAMSLCKFPQECLRRDRLSAFNSCYNGQSFEEAIKFEYENAIHVIGKESITGRLLWEIILLIRFYCMK